MKNENNVSPVSWIMEWAGTKRIYYVISIIMALFSVLFKIAPYFIIGEITGILLQDELDRPEISVEKPSDTSIRLKDVVFGYHDKKIIHGVNMDIKSGTVNAIVGPSGSGKSTIAKLIASLWDVDGGSISIGGADIRKM